MMIMMTIKMNYTIIAIMITRITRMTMTTTISMNTSQSVHLEV